MRAKRSIRNRNSTAKLISRLRSRVRELEETFVAIKQGKVDAVVASGPKGDQVFTLQGAEHPYRVLVETMNEGAATLDRDGAVLYANASFTGILGVPREKLIGKPLQDLPIFQEQEKLKALIEKGLRGLARGEVRVAHPEGQRRLVRLSLSPVQDFGFGTICVVATDMTELAEANEALKGSEEILRNLSGRILRLQDEERRRIARDLHDVTGQKLALLSMDLSSILKSKHFTKDADLNRIFLESISLSNDVNKEIRTLSYVLHPPLLDELGLNTAVEWFAQGFETRTGIPVTVDIPADFVRLGPEAEVALFRVVQESLSNVHRYSGSATAFVRATSSDGEARIEIGDYGKGMNAETKTPTLSMTPLGVGIQGMKERLRQLSGTLEITSRPGKGTLVTAILPISARPAEVPDLYEETSIPTAPVPSAREVEEGSRWRKRILIADDHDVLRRGIRTMLEGDPDLEICGEAVDGRDALEKTLAQGPDLVILDINMPIMNGLDVLRQIVRYRPQTKVLAFSVHDSKQIVEEILAAGAHGYLSKATAGQHLVQEVKSLLQTHARAGIA